MNKNHFSRSPKYHSNRLGNPSPSTLLPEDSKRFPNKSNVGFASPGRGSGGSGSPGSRSGSYSAGSGSLGSGSSSHSGGSGSHKGGAGNKMDKVKRSQSNSKAIGQEKSVPPMKNAFAGRRLYVFYFS